MTRAPSLSATLLVVLMAAGLAACEDPDQRVTLGNKYYRTLPPGDAVSWPSSGTSNGAGCVPPPGKPATC